MEPDRANLNDTEVLMQSARVVEVVGEEKRLKLGDKLVFGPASKPVTATISFYRERGEDESDEPHATTMTGQKVMLSDVQRMLQRSPGVVGVKDVKSEYRIEKAVTVGPGFECELVRVRMGRPGAGEYSYDRYVDIDIALGDDAPKMDLGTASSLSLVNQFRKGLIKRV